MAVTLRSGYDVGRQVADEPVVWVIDDFVDAVERAHIIELAAKGMGEAKVSRLGENAASEKRTGSVGWIKHDETPVIRGLVRRIGDLVGMPATHAESLQVVHYGVDQEYQPHFDAWDVTSQKGRQKTAKGGNRAVTALMYLNGVESGGSTCFPELDIEVAAVPGRLCLFHDLVEGSSNRHPHSLHGGMPVTAGEKWACNLWFRERRYQRGTTTGVPSRTTAPGTRAPTRKRRR